MGDIELLVIPKPLPMMDMFSNVMGQGDSLLPLLPGLGLIPRLNIKGHTTMGPKNKLLLHTPSGIPVDLFSTEARYWGMALAVRTGDSLFNIRLMQRLLLDGCHGHAYGGITDRHGVEHDVPDEETLFAFAGWAFQEPQDRG